MDGAKFLSKLWSIPTCWMENRALEWMSISSTATWFLCSKAPSPPPHWLENIPLGSKLGYILNLAYMLEMALLGHTTFGWSKVPVQAVINTYMLNGKQSAWVDIYIYIYIYTSLSLVYIYISTIHWLHTWNLFVLCFLRLAPPWIFQRRSLFSHRVERSLKKARLKRLGEDSTRKLQSQVKAA